MKHQLGEMAVKLQNITTKRVELIELLKRRTVDVPRKSRSLQFIFPHLLDKQTFVDVASDSLGYAEKNHWAKAEYEAQIEAEYDKISERLHPDCVIKAEFQDGELTLKIDDIVVLASIFLDDSEGNFVAAQWNVVGSTLSITAKTTGKKLCNELRKLVVTENQALVSQIIKYQEELATVEAQILENEAEINAEIYKLYKLTDAEIAMVEAG